MKWISMKNYKGDTGIWLVLSSVKNSKQKRGRGVKQVCRTVITNSAKNCNWVLEFRHLVTSGAV